MMNISGEGAALIKLFESCRLEAYPDPGTGDRPWTIGWGHTGPEVVPGLVWTQEQADNQFAIDVSSFVNDVNWLIEGYECTQNQFDALVSFAYNVGPDIDDDEIAEGLGDSTLLKLFMRGDIDGAADQFLLWKRAGGRAMRGLLYRRQCERALFIGEHWRDVYAAGPPSTA
jgi:lysozyme